MEDIVASMSESMIASAVEKMLYHFSIPVDDLDIDIRLKKDPNVKAGPKGIVMTVMSHKHSGDSLHFLLGEILQIIENSELFSRLEVKDFHCRLEPSFEERIEFFVYAIEHE